MGSWGYKALESDGGLDVIDFLEENIPQNYEFKLSVIIELMKNDGFFGTSKNEMDLTNGAIALAELYYMFKDNGRFTFECDLDNEKTLNDIKSFSAEKNSLEYLLECLLDIKKEITGENEMSDIVELWHDPKDWENWQNNLNELITKLKREIG